MASNVEIANLALTRIGHDVITSFSASGNKASRWFNTHYETIKKAVLRDHLWNFAIKHDVPTADTIGTITGITAANPPVVTCAAHGFSDGDTVYIASVLGMTEVNNKTFTVANKTTDTFDLSGVTGSAYTAYSSGGSLYGYAPVDYAYRFPLPGDCLRLVRINGGETTEYRVEGGFNNTGDSSRYIYTDESKIDIEYVFDVTDEADFDASFTDLLAARLGAEISFYLTDNSTLTEQAWKIHDAKLRNARAMDAREGTPRGIEADIWLQARV
ncbi:MAG: ubiquitin-activating E1 FCCH domain-containing protein [Flavobacteriaceae bacterium]